jgi:toxin FitB
LIILDTNVISELMRPDGEQVVENWLAANESAAWLSTVVLGELAHGIARLPTGKRKATLDRQLSEWRRRLADRTLVFSAEAAMIFGDIMASADAAGKPMSFADAQIAATAREHGATLATRNVKDFLTTGLRLVDPWVG